MKKVLKCTTIVWKFPAIALINNQAKVENSYSRNGIEQNVQVEQQ